MGTSRKKKDINNGNMVNIVNNGNCQTHHTTTTTTTSNNNNNNKKEKKKNQTELPQIKYSAWIVPESVIPIQFVVSIPLRKVHYFGFSSQAKGSKTHHLHTAQKRASANARNVAANCCLTESKLSLLAKTRSKRPSWQVLLSKTQGPKKAKWSLILKKNPSITFKNHLQLQ